jgi:ATP-dependent Clp protease protease subunit
MIALSLYLDSVDNKRVYYWLNCPGGEVSLDDCGRINGIHFNLYSGQVVPTLALYDTMQYMRSKTATVCYGMCLGMGGFLLTAGGEKVRVILIHHHNPLLTPLPLSLW